MTIQNNDILFWQIIENKILAWFELKSQGIFGSISGISAISNAVVIFTSRSAHLILIEYDLEDALSYHQIEQQTGPTVESHSGYRTPSSLSRSESFQQTSKPLTLKDIISSSPSRLSSSSILEAPMKEKPSVAHGGSALNPLNDDVVQRLFRRRLRIVRPEAYESTAGALPLVSIIWSTYTTPDDLTGRLTYAGLVEVDTDKSRDDTSAHLRLSEKKGNHPESSLVGSQVIIIVDNCVSVYQPFLLHRDNLNSSRRSLKLPLLLRICRFQAIHPIISACVTQVASPGAAPPAIGALHLASANPDTVDTWALPSLPRRKSSILLRGLLTSDESNETTWEYEKRVLERLLHTSASALRPALLTRFSFPNRDAPLSTSNNLSLFLKNNEDGGDEVIAKRCGETFRVPRIGIEHLLDTASSQTDDNTENRENRLSFSIRMFAYLETVLHRNASCNYSSIATGTSEMERLLRVWRDLRYALGKQFENQISRGVTDDQSRISILSYLSLRCLSSRIVLPVIIDLLCQQHDTLGDAVGGTEDRNSPTFLLVAALALESSLRFDFPAVEKAQSTPPLSDGELFRCLRWIVVILLGLVSEQLVSAASLSQHGGIYQNRVISRKCLRLFSEFLLSLCSSIQWTHYPTSAVGIWNIIIALLDTSTDSDDSKKSLLTKFSEVDEVTQLLSFFLSTIGAEFAGQDRESDSSALISVELNADSVDDSDLISRLLPQGFRALKSSLATIHQGDLKRNMEIISSVYEDSNGCFQAHILESLESTPNLRDHIILCWDGLIELHRNESQQSHPIHARICESLAITCRYHIDLFIEWLATQCQGLRVTVVTAVNVLCFLRSHPMASYPSAEPPLGALRTVIELLECLSSQTNEYFLSFWQLTNGNSADSTAQESKPHLSLSEFISLLDLFLSFLTLLAPSLHHSIPLLNSNMDSSYENFVSDVQLLSQCVLIASTLRLACETPHVLLSRTERLAHKICLKNLFKSESITDHSNSVDALLFQLVETQSNILTVIPDTALTTVEKHDIMHSLELCQRSIELVLLSLGSCHNLNIHAMTCQTMLELDDNMRRNLGQDIYSFQLRIRTCIAQSLILPFLPHQFETDDRPDNLRDPRGKSSFFDVCQTILNLFTSYVVLHQPNSNLSMSANTISIETATKTSAFVPLFSRFIAMVAEYCTAFARPYEAPIILKQEGPWRVLISSIHLKMQCAIEKQCRLDELIQRMCFDSIVGSLAPSCSIFEMLEILPPDIPCDLVLPFLSSCKGY